MSHAFGPEDIIGHGGQLYFSFEMASRVQYARPIVLGQISLNTPLISIYFNVIHCIITCAKDGCVFALGGLLNAQLKTWQWRGFDATRRRGHVKVHMGRRQVPPFQANFRTFYEVQT